jgi:hypothetical protein
MHESPTLSAADYEKMLAHDSQRAEAKDSCR